MEKVLAIIPCCGFGTRMNMKKSQSKELLIDPKTNEPLIKWHLDLCKQANLEPLILLRHEKQDLIKYCKDNNIRYLSMKPGKEWAHTVYKSKDYWQKWNILIFPDSRFFPEQSLSIMKQGPNEGSKLAFGFFKVNESDKWLCYENYGIYEKFKDLKGPYDAIGLIGFEKYMGERLFKGLMDSSMYRLKQDEGLSFTELTSFVDLTRTGKIESYE